MSTKRNFYNMANTKLFMGGSGGVAPTSINLLLMITPFMILISVMSVPTSSFGARLDISQDSNLLSHQFTLERKSCKSSTNCGNPNKECIDGKCFCKPSFDDVLTHSEGEDDGCMRSYGSSCNKTMHCNVYKNLICDDSRDGICVCHKHDEDYGNEGSLLIYDERLEKCAARPGGKCDLQKYYGGGTQIGCVSKAECVPDRNRTVDKNFFGICECVKGHGENSDGIRCVPGVGAKCEIDSDCDDTDTGGLSCSEGKCRCKVDRLHDKKSNKCRLKVGQDCEFEQGNCMDGTSCVLQSGSDPGKHYKWGWKCTCDEGRIFDEKRQHCSVKVGVDCGKYVVNHCVIHAFCGTANKCQCFEGYNATETGTCQKVEEIAMTEDDHPKMQNDQGKPSISGSGAGPPMAGDPDFIRSDSPPSTSSSLSTRQSHCVIIPIIPTSISVLITTAFVLFPVFSFDVI